MVNLYYGTLLQISHNRSVCFFGTPWWWSNLKMSIYLNHTIRYCQLLQNIWKKIQNRVQSIRHPSVLLLLCLYAAPVAIPCIFRRNKIGKCSPRSPFPVPPPFSQLPICLLAINMAEFAHDKNGLGMFISRLLSPSKDISLYTCESTNFQYGNLVNDAWRVEKSRFPGVLHFPGLDGKVRIFMRIWKKARITS